MRQPSPLGRRFLLAPGLFGTLLLPGLLPGWMPSALAASPSREAARVPPPRPNRAAAAPLIMLDPGHGGKDPGAIGVSGTHEKNITLATALELRRQLLATGRYRVELTRTRDVFVSLDERVTKAQAQKAALFISIHADALPDSAVRGASVYTQSQTASDEQSAALARRENSADRFAPGAFRDVPPEVGRILASLTRRETKLGAARIQQAMVRGLDRDLPMLSNPARHAGFVVLKAADIPSVLVEMGFMSNRQDEAALRRNDHRVRVASAMKRAVDGYFATLGHITRMAG